MSDRRKHTHKRGRRGGRVTHQKRGEVQCCICDRWLARFDVQGTFFNWPNGSIGFVCVEDQPMFMHFLELNGIGMRELELRDSRELYRAWVADSDRELGDSA